MAKANSWKVANLTPEQVDEMIAEYRERRLKLAKKNMADAVSDFDGYSLNNTRQIVGLSTSTISNYRKGKWGKRGPMYTTYLAFIGAHRRGGKV